MTLIERIESKAERPYKPRDCYPAVVTVRLPPEFHEQLKAVAHAQQISLNTLCVASLEHAVEQLGNVNHRPVAADLQQRNGPVSAR